MGREEPAHKPVEPTGAGDTAEEADREELSRVSNLESELAETRDYQSIQEQHEAANEELEASKEEVQSVNDEMGYRNPKLNRLNSDLTSVNDITERKRAEEALRRALAFDQAVMTNMGEGLYTVDAQGLVTSMNPAAEKLFGWKLDELLGKRMHDITHYKHPDGRPFPPEECAGFRVLKEGKKLADHEDVFIRKDGTFFDVVYSSSPLYEGDCLTGLVVVFRDVSGRKRAEDALRKSEQRFAQFMRHLPGLAWIKDAQGRYVYASTDTGAAASARTAARSLPSG